MSDGNVIDFRKAKAERAVPEYSYHVRIDQYGDGVAGCILDLGDNLAPDMLRLVSEQLFTLSRYIMDQAWEIGGNASDHILNQQTVFEDGKVRTWTADAIRTPEQIEWLRTSAIAGSDDIEPLGDAA